MAAQKEKRLMDKKKHQSAQEEIESTPSFFQNFQKYLFKTIQIASISTIIIFKKNKIN